MGAKSCSCQVCKKKKKVEIKSGSIIYFAISRDGKECWAKVCKDEQRYQKQKHRRKKIHVAVDIKNFPLDAMWYCSPVLVTSFGTLQAG